MLCSRFMFAMKKQLAILGSTGSIGRSALDIAERFPDLIDVVGLSTHSSIDLLVSQIQKFHPKYIVVTDQNSYLKFKKTFDFQSVELIEPSTGLERLAGHHDVDIVLNAVVGAAGLSASMATVRSGKRLALANKESMVIGGELLNDLRRQTGAEIIPVDSEHSAIWQAIHSGKSNEIKKIILTGSGGPFKDLPLDDFSKITLEQALNHPTWKMGPKITIDSATMMNKGLEVIEAVQLFGLPADKIEVVIHPQSIVHSMVEFIDSSIIAQMSYPDMRLPIAYALFYPDRIISDYGKANLVEIGHLTFESPNFAKFPLLKAAYVVAKIGGTMPAVFNAANEIAVDAFLKNVIEFHKIPDIVINSAERHNSIANPTYQDILDADLKGREFAREMIK